jgi:hypothetical protein
MYLYKKLSKILKGTSYSWNFMAREENKKLLSKQNIVSLFIVFIMVTSVIGYMFGKDGAESFKYKDYKFFRKGNEWILKVGGGELNFNFFPTDVENINLSSEAINRLEGVIEIDSTSDVNDSHAKIIALAQYSMQQVLGQVSTTYIRVGMTSENEFDLPIITCNDATVAVPVLFFKEANATNVELKNNCIIAEAKSEIDIVRIKDRLLYGILGII